jgi:hypothetical protein
MQDPSQPSKSTVCDQAGFVSFCLLDKAAWNSSQYAHDLPRGMLLAPKLQGQVHHSQEPGHPRLHQEHWFIQPCSYSQHTKHFQETEQESNYFIEFMKAKLAGKDTCDIINKDQTPLLYSFHSNKMLKNKGARTIHVCSSTADTKQVTFVIAIVVSGHMATFAYFQRCSKQKTC